MWQPLMEGLGLPLLADFPGFVLPVTGRAPDSGPSSKVDHCAVCGTPKHSVASDTVTALTFLGTAGPSWATTARAQRAVEEMIL
jgi:hypothetical protein